MKLPVDEEDNKQVMRVPEPLEIASTAFLNREPHHHSQRNVHDPSGHAGSSDKVDFEERDDSTA